MAFRVVTLRLPQLIRIGLIALGVIILGILFFCFFGNKSSAPNTGAAVYQPGIYTAAVEFGAQTVSVEVVMNKTGIQSVSYQIPEDVSSVYPLVATTSALIEKQAAAGGDLSAIQPESSAQDTASYLLRAIQSAKAKALQ